MTLTPEGRTPRGKAILNIQLIVCIGWLAGMIAGVIAYKIVKAIPDANTFHAYAIVAVSLLMMFAFVRW